MKAVRTTVDLWLARHAELGVAGLLDRSRGAGHEQVPARIRSRLLALSLAESTGGNGIVALVESGAGPVREPYDRSDDETTRH